MKTYTIHYMHDGRHWRLEVDGRSLRKQVAMLMRTDGVSRVRHEVTHDPRDQEPVPVGPDLLRR